MVIWRFMQKPGVDHFDTYAPTPTASSIRLLATLRVKRNIKLRNFGTQWAFVQPPLKDVFIELLPGCGYLTGRLVKKSLHSLKQASLNLCKLFTSSLIDDGLEQPLPHTCGSLKLDSRD